jgi:hypothetical protein
VEEADPPAGPPGDGRPTTTKTIAPTTPVSTITSSQTSLLLALNDRIVRDLDHIDEGAQPQTMKAASARTRMMMMTDPSDDTIDLTRGASREGVAKAMDEQRPYRTERERAVRASILGAFLGLMLAMFARQRRER